MWPLPGLDGLGATPLPLGGTRFSLLYSGNNGMFVYAVEEANGPIHTEGKEVHRAPLRGGPPSTMPAPPRRPPPSPEAPTPELFTAPATASSGRDSAQGGALEPLPRALNPGQEGASSGFYVLQHEEQRGRGTKALTLVGGLYHAKDLRQAGSSPLPGLQASGPPWARVSSGCKAARRPSPLSLVLDAQPVPLILMLQPLPSALAYCSQE